MEAIITRLREIDEAAAAILDHTAAQKQLSQERMQKKTMEFDEALQKENQNKIKTMKAEMDAKIENELKQLAAQTDGEIKSLQKLFSQNKEKIAGEIFEYVTGAAWQG